MHGRRKRRVQYRVLHGEKKTCAFCFNTAFCTSENEPLDAGDRRRELSVTKRDTDREKRQNEAGDYSPELPLHKRDKDAGHWAMGPCRGF